MFLDNRSIKVRPRPHAVTNVLSAFQHASSCFCGPQNVLSSLRFHESSGLISYQGSPFVALDNTKTPSAFFNILSQHSRLSIIDQTDADGFLARFLVFMFFSFPRYVFRQIQSPSNEAVFFLIYFE